MALKFLSPILWTKDLDETKSFYEEILGFKGRSNFPNFISLVKDDIEIMFVVPQEEPESCIEPGRNEEFFPRPNLTGSLFIITSEVDDFWDLIKDKVTIKDGLADREYQMRDFSILDNNGYELVFGQDISH